MTPSSPPSFPVGEPAPGPRDGTPVRSLGRVVLLGLGGALALVYLLGHALVSQPMRARLEAHEIIDGEEHGRRLLAALDHELFRLERTARDWGNRDESHAFLQGQNPAFPREHLDPATLANIDVNLVALVAADGSQRALSNVRSVTGAPLDLPPEALQLLSPGGPWLEAHRTDTPLRGYASTSIGLLAFVSVPVHRSEAKDPERSNGILVMGRFLDASLVQELRDSTRTSLEIHDLGAPELPSDVARAAATIGERPVLALPLDDDRLGSYAALRDLLGAVVGIARHVTPRPGHALAREAERRLLLLRLAGAVLFGVCLYVFIQRRVLRRLRLLDAALVEVSRGDHDVRVPDLGQDDELARLGQNVNALLDELKARQDAREARDAVLTASRMKSDLLATLSREIRQPLNGVLGALEVALERELSPVVRPRLDEAYRAATGLVALLNDVLDFSKVNPATRAVEATDFDLRALVEDVTTLFAPRAGQHGLALDCYVDPKLARLYEGDQHRLRQVLANLVDNAIKFTLRGEVTVRATLMGRRADADSIVISVSDTGIGFSPGQLGSFFDDGGRDGAVRPAAQAGGGIGLAVAKQIVTQLGGLLDVNSTVGEGSRISAALRLKRLDEGSIGLFDQFAGRHALLLGDDSGCLGVLAEYLAAMGIVVTRAATLDAATPRVDFVAAVVPTLAALPALHDLPAIAVLPPGTPPGPIGTQLVRITWPIQLHLLQRAVNQVCLGLEPGVPDLGRGI